MLFLQISQMLAYLFVLAKDWGKHYIHANGVVMMVQQIYEIHQNFRLPLL